MYAVQRDVCYGPIQGTSGIQQYCKFRRHIGPAIYVHLTMMADSAILFTTNYKYFYNCWLNTCFGLIPIFYYFTHDVTVSSLLTVFCYTLQLLNF